MSSITRAIAVAAATFAAAALPVLAAAPAQAETDHCLEFLNSRGYDIDRFVVDACGKGANFFEETELCTDRLVDHGVRPWHAVEACERAGW